MPKKRSNGEGALRKRQNGLWECMIMTGFQPKRKEKIQELLREDAERSFAEGQGLPDSY